MPDKQKVVDLIKQYENLRVVNWPEAIQMSNQFLDLLFDMEPEDIFPRAMIRFLFKSGGWPLGVKVDNPEAWSNVLEKFFAASTGGNKFVPDNYIELTKAIIKDSFDYDIPDPVKTVETETKKPVKKTAAKKTKKPSDEGESGSKVFKSIAEALAEPVEE